MVVFGSVWRAEFALRRPTVRHVGGAFVSFVALAASGGSPVMRADSSPRPLDRARVTDNQVIVSAFVNSAFLDIPPNVSAQPLALTIPPARVG